MTLSVVSPEVYPLLLTNGINAVAYTLADIALWLTAAVFWWLKDKIKED